MELTNFSQDLLNRMILAKNLTNILEHKEDLRVLAIDSSWGTGKTTFINMWIDMINNEKDTSDNYIYNEKFETMYFNAWENDYISEPIISLLAELNNQIKDKDGKVKSFIEKGKDKAKPYLKVGGQILLRYLTRNALDNVEWDKDIEDDLLELSNKIGEVAFKEASIAKNSRETLKNDLAEFQYKIDKKVIIFIDELDRCRPTYAIELLEVIKHIFDIDNYIFVISLDKEQLSHSIKTLYGEGMDSNGYLRRFFDLEYRLPMLKKKEYIREKCTKTLSYFSNSKFFIDIFTNILIKENYSLRDINKAFNYLSLITPKLGVLQDLSYSTPYTLGISFIYAELINFKFKKNSIYTKIINIDYSLSDNDINEISNNIVDIFDVKIIRDLDVNTLRDFLIDSFNTFLKALSIINITPTYLTTHEVNKKGFVVTLPNNLGDFDILSWLKFNYSDSDVINNLEFADSFVL